MQSVDGGFPVLTVKIPDGYILDMPGIQAVNIYAEPIGVRARYIEGLDAAMSAEQMFCGAGVEAVGGQAILALQQVKVLLADDQMKKTGHPADRAIAT